MLVIFLIFLSPSFLFLLPLQLLLINHLTCCFCWLMCCFHWCNVIIIGSIWTFLWESVMSKFCYFLSIYKLISDKNPDWISSKNCLQLKFLQSTAISDMQHITVPWRDAGGVSAWRDGCKFQHIWWLQKLTIPTLTSGDRAKKKSEVGLSYITL